LGQSIARLANIFENCSILNWKQLRLDVASKMRTGVGRHQNTALHSPPGFKPRLTLWAEVNPSRAVRWTVSNHWWPAAAI